jgi:hypothetical protein
MAPLRVDVLVDQGVTVAITRQTLYRHVAPDGTLRKVVEGGKIRYDKKKWLPRPGLTLFSVQLLLRPLYSFICRTPLSRSSDGLSKAIRGILQR